MAIYNNILGLIGNTPVVKINKIYKGEGEIFAKLEYFNPANSIKDRPAYNIIKSAIDKGLVDDETVIIEPTSGNMGIGLGLVASVLGLKLVVVMPENMSEERKKMIKAYGAKLVLTPKEFGMKGAVDKVNELSKEYKNSFVPSQFENPDNPKAHVQTAKEILKDVEGVTKIVAGFGTGGTLTGIAEEIKKHKKNVKFIGVEPYESPLITEGKASAHKIQGIGANFVPKNLKVELLDEIVTVKGDEAIKTAKELASKEGILTGISSGAAMRAAIEVTQKNDKTVVILPDYGERYVSTELFE